jgi:hypothetical protein
MSEPRFPRAPSLRPQPQADEQSDSALHSELALLSLQSSFARRILPLASVFGSCRPSMPRGLSLADAQRFAKAGVPRCD